MGSIRWFHLTLFLAFIANALCTIGQPCFLGFYRHGVCTLESNCGSLRRNIVNGNIYLCGYINGQPLICCPQNFNAYPRYGHDPYNYGWHDRNRFRPGRRRRPYANNDDGAEEINVPTPIAEDAYSIVKAKCEEYQERPQTTTEASGEAQFRPFVVGGTNARENEFPHMTALGFGERGEERWLCGGSLISERYVLTAAHCLLTQQVGEVKWARLGATNVRNVDANVQDFEVIERIPHPEYKQPIQYNDLGLIKLDRDVIFNANLRPICLPTVADLNDTIPIATGWGRVEYGGSTSDDLKKVEISYYTIERCREPYANISPDQLPNGIMDDTQICAGGIDEDKDTCQGDSGGPLQIRNPNVAKGHILVGITSFGRGCGVRNVPGVYTRLFPYIPWIQTIVWP